MTVFNTYFKIMKKNARMMFIYIAIFVAMAIGNVVSGDQDVKTDINSNVRISVINMEQNNQRSQGLKDYLESNFKPIKIKSDDRSIRENLLSSYVDYVLKIGKDGKLKYYISKDQGKSFMVNQKAMEYLKTYDLMDKYRFEGMAKPEEILKEKIEVGYIGQSRAKRDIKQNMYGYYNVSSYVIFIILMLGAFTGQYSFNSKKISDRIRVSKVSPRKISLNVFYSSLSFVILVWAIFFVIALASFRTNMFTSYGRNFVLASILYLLPTSAMSYLFANLSKNPAVNNGLSNMLGLLFSFTSGVFIPLKYVPSYIEMLAIVSPMYWNNKIYSAIVDSSSSGKGIIVYVFIQALIGLACLFIGLAIKNKSMESRSA